MAEVSSRQAAPASGGVEAPHDRVVGLSLNKDGTPDQNNPEIIGDKDAAVAVAKKQFAEWAVSAVDHKQRTADAAAADGSDADAVIDARKAEHEKVAKAAEAKAESVVSSLHKGK